MASLEEAVLQTYQPLSNFGRAFGANPCASSIGKNVGIQWDDKETLFRRIKEVGEEVTCIRSMSVIDSLNNATGLA